MADVSKITINGSTYNIKDATAREDLLEKQDLIQIDPAGSSVPDDGEIVVVDGGIKIGDGTTTVSNLPAVGAVEVVRL